MSKVIDDNVVKVSLENREFKKEADKTISLLDRIKKTANRRESGDMLAGTERSAAKANISLEKMNDAAATSSKKFNALGVAGVGALMSIGSKAVSVGASVVKSLTLDPVLDGFREYEMQLNSVQTILANTKHKGSTITDVNNALNELNKYADQTIYNFGQMTRNIGTFTAAGVGLQDSVNAIKGISNLAAMSGSSAEQASSAMYQLSQALAAGKVGMQDWNSVVNAGMGGKQFQDALIRTAENMGVNVREKIKNKGSFRETLRNDETWLNADILIETLKQISGAYDEAQLKAKGYSDSEAKAIVDMSKTATDAATKVKTFTQMLDVMKESVQSGWAESFKIIFGDFEQAKEIFTSLTNKISPFIENMSNARNELLRGGFQNTNGWGKFSDTFKSLGVDVEVLKAKTAEVAKSYGVDVDALIKKHGSFANSLEAGWMKTEYLSKALEQMGHTMKLTGEEQTAFNKKLEDFKTKAIAIASDPKLSMDEKMKKFAEAGMDAKTAMDIYNKSLHGQKIELSTLNKEQLKAIGFTDDQILKMRDLSREVNMTGTELNKLAKHATNANGRVLLLKGLANVLRPLLQVIKSVSSAFRSIFPPMTGVQLYNLISSFEQFTGRLQLSEKTINDLTMTFKGLFAAIDIVLKIVGGPARIILDVVKGVIEGIGQAMGLTTSEFLSATAKIGQALVNLNNMFDISGLVAKITAKLVPAINNIFGALMPSLHRLLRRFSDGLAAIGTELVPLIGRVLNNAFNSIDSVLSKIYPKFKEFGKWIIEGLKHGIGEGVEKVLHPIIEMAKKICSTFAKILGIHSPSRVFFEFGQNIIQGLVNGIRSISHNVAYSIRDIGMAIVDVFNSLDVGKVVMLTLTLPMAEAIHKFGNMFQSMSTVITSFKNPLKGMNLMGLLGLTPLTDAAKIFANSQLMEAKSKMIISFAGAIAILAGSMKLLSTIDSGGVARASEAMISIGIAAGMFLGGLRLIGGIGVGDATISKFVFSVLGMVAAVKLLNGISVGSAMKTLGSLTIIVGGFNLVMKLIALVPGDTGDVNNMVDATDKLMKVILKFLGLSALAMLIPKGAIRKMEEISLFVGALTGVVMLMSKFNSKGRNLNKTINTAKEMAKVLGVFSGILIAMSLFKANPNLEAVSSLLILIEGMLLIELQIRKIAQIKNVRKDKVQSILKDLGIIMSELAAFSILMSVFNVSISTDTAASIAMVAGIALGVEASVRGLALIKGVNSAKVQQILLELGVIMGSLGAFAIIMSTFNVNISLETGQSLALMVASVIGVAFAIQGLSMLPAINSAAVLPLLAEAGLVVAACAAFGGIVTGLNLKIDTGLIGDIIITTGAIGAVAVALGLLGPILTGATSGMVAAVPAIAIAIGVLAAIAGLMAGLGAIVEQLNGFRDMMNEAFDILADVMYGIGKVTTSIIGGMTDGIFSGLPAIGEHISNFLNAFKGVDGSIIDSVKNVSKAILMLTAGGGLNSFVGMITKENPMETMGPQLTSFGQGLKMFADTLKGVDLEALSKGASAGEALGKMSQSFAGQGLSFMSMLGGRKDMSEIGQQLSQFGFGLKAFSNSIEGIDTGAIKKAAKAGEALGEMQNAFDGQGLSVESFMFGEKDLSVIGPQLSDFGRGMAAFSSSLEGVNTEQIEKAAAAGKALGKMQNAFDGQGWSVESFMFGEKDMSVIGEQLPKLGKGMSKFANSVKDVNTDQIQKAAKSLKSMAKFANSLPEMGGLRGFIEGDVDIEGFGEAIAPLGKALRSFQKNLSGVPEKFDFLKYTDTLRDMASFAKSLEAEDFSLGNIDAFTSAANKMADEIAPALAKFSKAFKGKKGKQTVTPGEVDSIIKSIQPLITMMDQLDGIVGGDSSGTDLTNLAEDFNSAVAELSKLKLTGLKKIYTNGKGAIKPDELEHTLGSVNQVLTIIKSIDDATTNNKGKSNDLEGRVEEFNNAVAQLGKLKLTELNNLAGKEFTVKDENGLTKLQNVGNVIKQVADITATISNAVGDNSIVGRIRGGTKDLDKQITEFKKSVTALKGINLDDLLDGLLDGEGKKKRKNIDATSFDGIKGAMTAITEIMKSITSIEGDKQSTLLQGSELTERIDTFKTGVTSLMELNLDTVLDKMMDGKNSKRKALNIDQFNNIKDAITAITTIFSSISTVMGSATSNMNGVSQAEQVEQKITAFKKSVKVLSDINLDSILDGMLDGKVSNGEGNRYSLNIEQFKQIQQAIGSVNDMIKAIMESMSSVKAGDGIAQGETIRQQIQTFKSSALIIAELNLQEIINKMTGGVGGELDTAPMTSIAAAISQLNEVMGEIQESVKTKKGEAKLGKSIQTFKSSVLSLAELNITEIMNQLTGGSEINTEAVTQVTNAVTALATMLDTVQNTLQTKKGEKGIGTSIKTFKTSLEELRGLNLPSVVASLSGGGEMSTEGLGTAVSAVRRLAQVIGEISGHKFKAGNVAGFVDSANQLAKIQLSAIAAALDTGGKKIHSSGVNISKHLAAGIKAGMGAVRSAANGLSSAACSSMGKSVSKAQNEGSKTGSAYAKGISSKSGSARSAGSAIAKAAAAGVSSAGLRATMYSHGRNASIGLAEGIRSGLGAAASAANELARIAAKAAKAKLDIHSPSRVFREIGGYVGEGFALGMNNSQGIVSKSSSNLASRSISIVRAMVNDVSSEIQDGINTNIDPVITPVVDLNNVNKASGLVNDMLSTDASISASLAVKQQDSIINALNSRTNTKDIISEMRKLGKNIVDNSGNSTVINGITYDDGSNITSMVGELVRTAKIDGRS